MGVALCCLRAGMTEEAPDQLKRCALSGGYACKRMAEVVNTHIFEISKSAYTTPWFLQIDEVATDAMSDEDMRVAVNARKRRQEFHGRSVQKDGLLASLGVWQRNQSPL